MPLQRNQPSPERQSVLSFVSPSVADLLFFETVDAKTVGAGSGKTITVASKATFTLVTGNIPDDTVETGFHSSGFTITLTCDGHGFEIGDVVTVEDVGYTGTSPNGTYQITAIDESSTDTFSYFVKDTPSTLSVTNNPRVYKAHPSYGTAHPDTENFSKHKLCYVKQADGEGLFFQYYYAAERLHQDDYNFEFSQADLGGNKYDTIVRTYVTLRSDFTEADAKYNAGDRMPDVPNAKFPDDTYILMTRQQKRIGDQELDGLFVVEQRVYFNRVDIVTQSLDATTGGVLGSTVKLYYRGEIYTGSTTIQTAAAATTLWGLAATGINTDVEQLSNDWWKVTIQDVIPQGLGSAHGGKLIRTFTTYQNFSWPPVVGEILFTSAPKKDGSAKTVVTIRNKEGKDGFSGPTKMVVEQVWSLAALTPPAVDVFKTVSGTYDGVQFRCSLSNSLTEAITLTDLIGTKDPVYKMGEYGFPKPWIKASDPTDWPATHVGASTQKPFRGGYLLEVVTIHEPA
jgi:hypothetical protein